MKSSSGTRGGEGVAKVDNVEEWREELKNFRKMVEDEIKYRSKIWKKKGNEGELPESEKPKILAQQCIEGYDVASMMLWIDGELQTITLNHYLSQKRLKKWQIKDGKKLSREMKRLEKLSKRSTKSISIGNFSDHSNKSGGKYSNRSIETRGSYSTDNETRGTYNNETRETRGTESDMIEGSTRTRSRSLSPDAAKDGNTITNSNLRPGSGGSNRRSTTEENFNLLGDNNIEAEVVEGTKDEYKVKYSFRSNKSSSRRAVTINDVGRNRMNSTSSSKSNNNINMIGRFFNIQSYLVGALFVKL